MLPQLRARWPKLRLFLREETNHDAVESLHHGRADCVLLALPYATGEVEVEHICDDRLFVEPFISTTTTSDGDVVTFTGSVGLSEKAFSKRYADMEKLLAGVTR